MKKRIQNVTIIGAGNVASWFAFVLHKQGITIQQIYSRDKTHRLAKQYHTIGVNNLTDLQENSDLYLFCLKDEAYGEVIGRIPFQLPRAVHTSGSLSMNILQPVSQQFGVIYPYQTISQNFPFTDLVVPLCVEANNDTAVADLFAFSQQLSNIVHHICEKERNKLHLAAVFASNFTNALYGVAYNLLQEAQLDWKLILPLLQQTLYKTTQLPPHLAQTGPAKRGDINILKFHLQQLNDEKYREIYQILSNYILEQKSE